MYFMYFECPLLASSGITVGVDIFGGLSYNWFEEDVGLSSEFAKWKYGACGIMKIKMA